MLQRSWLSHLSTRILGSAWLLLMLVLASAQERLPERLVVLDIDRLPAAEQLLAMTLQGLANRESAQVWITAGGMQSAVLADLEQRGVVLQRVASPWEVLSALPSLPSAITYDATRTEVPVVAALCAAYGAVAVEESLRPAARERGLNLDRSADGWDQARVWRACQATFTKGILIEQTPKKPAHLLDFAIARRAFVTYGQNDATVTELVRALGPDTQVFGWGEDELAIVGRVSTGGGTYLPADWSRNLSALQHLPVTIPILPRPATFPPVVDGERLVAFVMSDGDNLQFLGGPFTTSTGHWGSPLRGHFTMTWEMAPLLSTLAPRIMARIYASASGGAAYDDFVSGPSGAGYCIPSLLPDRARFAATTAPLLRSSQLQIVSVLNSGGGMEQTSELLEQPEVLGVIYKDFAPYNARHGAVWWHQGKPCVAYRYLLWEGLPGQSPDEVAAAIATLPAAPTHDPASYVLINVHAWSYAKAGGPMAAVQRTIEHLPPRTRVVSATELFTHLREHFGTPVTKASKE
jgi:GxGYxYP putative glycoside hydrolase C-terminal domain/GxGYxY sequence motif in domain of unknown function N-terminal